MRVNDERVNNLADWTPTENDDALDWQEAIQLARDLRDARADIERLRYERDDLDTQLHDEPPWFELNKLQEQNHALLEALLDGIAAAPELYKFLDRAMPWLAKAKADGLFDNCGMPSELDRVFEMGNRIRDDIEAEA